MNLSGLHRLFRHGGSGSEDGVPGGQSDWPEGSTASSVSRAAATHLSAHFSIVALDGAAFDRDVRRRLAYHIIYQTSRARHDIDS